MQTVVERPFFEELQDLPDDGIISEDFSSPPNYDIGTFEAGDMLGFYDSFNKYNSLRMTNGFEPIEPGLIREMVKHEQSHALAAKKAGFMSVRYSLVYWNSAEDLDEDGWEPTLSHYRPARPVTKLAIASIAAAPKYLSPMDQVSLQSMGYSGADDVAERIELHNSLSASAAKLMMPGSANAVKRKRPGFARI